MKKEESKKWEEAYFKDRRNLKSRKRRIDIFDFNSCLKKDPTILDLGCGDGLDMIILKQRGFGKIIGIDNSKKFIKICKKKGLNVQFASAYYLPFKNDSFDIVYINSVLHHLDLKKVLSEIKRILKPSGWLCFIEPRNCLIRRFLDFLTLSPLGKYLPKLKNRRETLKIEYDDMYNWLNNQKNLKQILKDMGFKIILWKKDFLSIIVKCLKDEGKN